jgi:peroxidase
VLLSPFAAAQLKTGYYASICPNLEAIIQTSVKKSMAQSQISGPAALRLFFHDCAVRVRTHAASIPVHDDQWLTYAVRCVQGCDASIMIVNSNGDDEWHNPDDQSLKSQGFQTILDAKAAVDNDPQCRYTVSCADILALAAREAVSQVVQPAKQLETKFPRNGHGLACAKSERNSLW